MVSLRIILSKSLHTANSALVWARTQLSQSLFCCNCKPSHYYIIIRKNSTFTFHTWCMWRWLTQRKAKAKWNLICWGEAENPDHWKTSILKFHYLKLISFWRCSTRYQLWIALKPSTAFLCCSNTVKVGLDSGLRTGPSPSTDCYPYPSSITWSPLALTQNILIVFIHSQTPLSLLIHGHPVLRVRKPLYVHVLDPSVELFMSIFY